MFEEFKKFVMRGNVLDLAVGVIIGGAFGKITASLVGDVLMPVIGLGLGDVDFSQLFINLSETEYATLAEAQEAGAATLNYGMFVNTVVEFLIIAFAVFMIVKTANSMKEPPPAAAPTTKECPKCFSTIPIRATRCPNCTSELTA